MENTIRQCLSCGKKLHGRADKKFCNDYCRNAFNNSKKTTENPLVKRINNVLLKNRRILDQLLGQEKTTKAHQDKLVQQGFNFNFITHTYQNKNGDIYRFCYEMGYLPLDNGWNLVVRRKDTDEKKLNTAPNPAVSDTTAAQ